MSGLIKSFHLIAIVHYFYGLHYYVSYVNEQEILHRGYEFGGIFVYLTYLSFVSYYVWTLNEHFGNVNCFQMIHAFYFTLSLLNDFFGSTKVSVHNRPLITTFRDYCFASFVVPLTSDVAGMFWILYKIDRELVFPQTLDAFFPWWLNIFVHANIGVFILVEMILLHHKYPSRKSGLTGLGIFMTGYLMWVHCIKYNSGHWVYLVLNVLSSVQRTLFFVVLMPVGMSLYYVGEFVNNKIWSEKRILEGSKEVKVSSNKSKTKNKKSCWDRFLKILL